MYAKHPNLRSFTYYHSAAKYYYHLRERGGPVGGGPLDSTPIIERQACIQCLGLALLGGHSWLGVTTWSLSAKYMHACIHVFCGSPALPDRPSAFLPAFPVFPVLEALVFLFFL